MHKYLPPPNIVYLSALKAATTVSLGYFLASYQSFTQEEKVFVLTFCRTEWLVIYKPPGMPIPVWLKLLAGKLILQGVLESSLRMKNLLAY